MIPKEELLRLNKEGFIPGPLEKEDDFLKRIKLSKKLIKDPKFFFKDQNQQEPFELDNRILRPRWNWTRAQLLHLFDVSPQYLALFYSNKDLHFFQAAATWILSIGENKINIPVLQFRKVLRRKPYLFIYTLDEILAHETVHSVRVAFDEPKTEEIFSYMTASNIFRKIFGPIIRSSRDVFLFFSLMGTYFISQILWILSNYKIFSYLSTLIGVGTLSILSMGLMRLFFIRRRFRKTYKKLFKIFNDKKKARAVLFRLTDDEIINFSKMKRDEIQKYINETKDASLRMQVIYYAYFIND